MAVATPGKNGNRWWGSCFPTQAELGWGTLVWCRYLNFQGRCFDHPFATFRVRSTLTDAFTAVVKSLKDNCRSLRFGRDDKRSGVIGELY